MPERQTSPENQLTLARIGFEVGKYFAGGAAGAIFAPTNESAVVALGVGAGLMLAIDVCRGIHQFIHAPSPKILTKAQIEGHANIQPELDKLDKEIEVTRQDVAAKIQKRKAKKLQPQAKPVASSEQPPKQPAERPVFKPASSDLRGQLAERERTKKYNARHAYDKLGPLE